MNEPRGKLSRLANKTFFRFVFSFVGVIAAALLVILAIGIGGDAN